MKELNEEDFLEDIVAVLTLPEEAVKILITGPMGVVEPDIFFQKFVRKFHPELGVVRYKPGRYIIEDHAEVTFSIDGEERGYWDYEVHLYTLHPFIQAVSKTGRTTRTIQYYLSKEIMELFEPVST